MALTIFPKSTTVYFDLDRKLCDEYVSDLDEPDLIINQALNNDELIEASLDVIESGANVVIDSLPNQGNHLRDDRERFQWLTRAFNRIQRALLGTDCVVTVLNQIRQVPSTGSVYNPHEGCLDASVKIKLTTAEKRGRDRLIYVEIEKSFWGLEGERCTLLVSKVNVTER